MIKKKFKANKKFYFFSDFFLRQKSSIQVFFLGLCQKYLTFLLGLCQFSDRRTLRTLKTNFEEADGLGTNLKNF